MCLCSQCYPIKSKIWMIMLRVSIAFMRCGIVLEIIFSETRKSCKLDNENKSYNTFKVWVFFCNVFQQICISGISGVIGQVTKVTCLINPRDKLELGTQGEILIWQRKS